MNDDQPSCIEEKEETRYAPCPLERLSSPSLDINANIVFFFFPFFFFSMRMIPLVSTGKIIVAVAF